VKVVITGADGFLGRHLRVRLFAQGAHKVICVGRATFAEDERLCGDLRGSDAVIHLAGVNRDAPDVVERENESVAQRLVDCLDAIGRVPVVVYANSVQAGRDTPYGRGKQRAAEVIGCWAAHHEGRFANVLLPNIYGEWGRPNYNSFVATFCARLAVGTPPLIDEDRELPLLHAQDVAQVLIDQLDGPATQTEVVPEGWPTSVGEVAIRLTELAATYATGLIPDLSDPFALRLFNTYRSYLYPDRFPMPITAHNDVRGTFVETAQSLGGQGQSSYSTTAKGVTRGDHFHLRKVERFVVVRGRARICLRPVWGGPVWTYNVSGDSPALVDMPTLVTHNITNVGEDELGTVFWINEIFDPDDPDTFADAVA
jgi:UDP-2-acetamido-2,6-beta-L-arabino-hexul-4-ose reductase